jgi:hypothetical protein
MSNPLVHDKLPLLPDFSDATAVLAVLVVPLAIQWWSTWYPGSEPGGGGYIAQRMLAAPDEKQAMAATLWFNIAHYALRPWPWILVALASLIVYPELSDIRARFPHLDPSILRHDLAYPAMLVFVPHGILGLIVASLAAAYMSTISTHLNWGASYVVDDVYRRFIKPSASEQHYVNVGRGVTVALMLFACLVALWLRNAMQAFQILLQIGAGTGLIFLLPLVAHQCVGRDRRHGDFIPARGLFPFRPCAARVCAASSDARPRDWRHDHHVRLACRDATHAAHGSLRASILLRQNTPGARGLAWCRGYERRRKRRQYRRVVPRLVSGLPFRLRNSVCDRLSALWPLRDRHCLRRSRRGCGFWPLENYTQGWLLDGLSFLYRPSTKTRFPGERR